MTQKKKTMKTFEETGSESLILKKPKRLQFICKTVFN